MVDIGDLKSPDRKVVRVRVSPPAIMIRNIIFDCDGMIVHRDATFTVRIGHIAFRGTEIAYNPHRPRPYYI
jgi:hypothetical protein